MNLKTPCIAIGAAWIASATLEAQTTILPVQSGGGSLPAGWTEINNIAGNDIDRGTYWLVDSGSPGDFIVSADYDLSAFTDTTISVDVASFGSGVHNSLKVEYSVDSGANWSPMSFNSATTTSSSYITGGPISVSTSFSATTRFRFSSSGSSGRGVRIRNLGITAINAGPDTDPPVFLGSLPASGDDNVSTGSSISLTFDETIQAGTGFIRLFDGGGEVEAFDVTTDAVFTDDTVTVTPSSPLSPSTAYYVQVDSTAITDDDVSSPNVFPGISDNTTLTFETNPYLAANPGDIVITEIMQNPSAVSDEDGEWFEVFNNASGAIDLNGWTIGTENHVIDNGGPLVIAAGQYLVFGINSDTPTNGGVTVDYEYSSVTLANGSDTLTLSDPSASEIDRVEWDNGASFPDPDGASMALASPALDNNVGSNWFTSSTAYGDGDLGSPGAANPTPDSLALSLSSSTFSESAGFDVSTLTITRTDTTGDLDVTVISSDSSEAQVQLTTVTILDGDTDETVNIDAIDDLWPDGDQSVTITASAPGFIDSQIPLTVQDDSDPLGLVINEVYYAPDGSLQDANGDGNFPTYEDEFIEIVNAGATPFDLSFCSIIENGFDFNARGPVHFFPEGTILAPGAAIVVFNGGNIADGSTVAFGTAEIQKASEGGLHLSDDGDNIRLRNAFDEELYGIILPDESTLAASGSLTLSPDITPAGGYIPHTTTTSGTEYSPGTQTDGTPFVTITDAVGVAVNTPSVDEDAGFAGAAITVSVPAPVVADTIIRLESSDEDSLFVQDTATILMGTSSVDVDVFPIDESIDDSDALVSITATLSGYLNGEGTLTVVNDDVTFTDLVINEVDADTTDAVGTGSNDQLEFVELFNKTGSPQSLTGLVLVLFNGSDNASYEAYDLSGQTIPANGYFVIGNSAVSNVDLVIAENTLQNGPDAVALISGNILDFSNDTPVGSFAGTLVDAVVYGTDDSDASALLTALTPSGTQLDEGAFPDSQSVSNSRATDGGAAFDTSLFVAQTPTPGATNVLPENSFATWAADQVPPIVDGPDGDADLDGIANLVEYALGLDPNAANGAPGTLSGGTLSFTKGAEAKMDGNLIYEIETSTDLGITDPWAPNGAAVDGSDDISIDILTAGGVETKFFARLKVSEAVVAE